LFWYTASPQEFAAVLTALYFYNYCRFTRDINFPNGFFRVMLINVYEYHLSAMQLPQPDWLNYSISSITLTCDQASFLAGKRRFLPLCPLADKNKKRPITGYDQTLLQWRSLLEFVRSFVERTTPMETLSKTGE